MTHKIDTPWFRARLRDASMTQRDLAKKLNLDAATVSLMLRGMRRVTIEEAGKIAAILKTPATEILTRLGMDPSITQGNAVLDPTNAKTPIVGQIDGDGIVTFHKPVGALRGVVGLRVVSTDSLDGAVLGVRVSGAPVDANWIGQIGVVDVKDHGRRLGTIMRGREMDRFNVRPALGIRVSMENVELAAGWPLAWVRWD